MDYNKRVSCGQVATAYYLCTLPPGVATNDTRKECLMELDDMVKQCAGEPVAAMRAKPKWSSAEDVIASLKQGEREAIALYQRAIRLISSAALEKILADEKEHLAILDRLFRAGDGHTVNKLSPNEAARKRLGVPTREMRQDNPIDGLISDVAQTQAPMKLMTQELFDSMPALYSQQYVDDPLIRVKFFNPSGAGTWGAYEGGYDDGQYLFFGWATLQEAEPGYFSLDDVQENGMERDLYFKPIPLSKFKEQYP